MLHVHRFMEYQSHIRTLKIQQQQQNTLRTNVAYNKWAYISGKISSIGVSISMTIVFKCNLKKKKQEVYKIVLITRISQINWGNVCTIYSC